MPKDKDTYYLKLDINSYDDPKVKLIRKYHENMFAFGSYILIALKLRQEADCNLDYNEFTFEALGIDMGKTPEEVKKFIDDCIKFRLFKKVDDKFFSERVNRDKSKLDEKREQARMAGIISAEKRKHLPSIQPEPKPIKKPKAPAKLDDVLIPSPQESELLEVIKVLSGWDYKEGEDLEWLRILGKDFQNLTLDNFKALADYFSDKPERKGAWKSRIRNWLKKELAFNKEKASGAYKGSSRQIPTEYKTPGQHREEYQKK